MIKKTAVILAALTNVVALSACDPAEKEFNLHVVGDVGTVFTVSITTDMETEVHVDEKIPATKHWVQTVKARRVSMTVSRKNGGEITCTIYKQGALDDANSGNSPKGTTSRATCQAHA